MRMEDREFGGGRRKRKSQGFSFDEIRDYVIDHYQYFGVGILFICLVIILSIFSSAVKDEVENSASNEKTKGTYSVPDVELEVDAHPDVNELVDKYFKATEAGDIDTLSQICSELDEKEAIRIQKKAEVTESYSNFACYTKPGPEENSYIVFEYFEIKFNNIETLAPGLTSLYIKTKPDGTLYIYDGELSDDESEYIKEIAAQKDVVELLNTVDKKYNEAASKDETLKNFMDVLPTVLDEAVETEMAKKESGTQETEADAVTEETDMFKNFQVKSIDNVNVRSAPDKEAEKLGQLMAGDTFTCIEAMPNGWSQIDFQGTTAYVKTEYIARLNEDGTTSPIDTASIPGAEEQQGGDDTQTTDGGQAAGQIKVNETVRVRKGPSTNDEILGQAEGGAIYDLLGEENGWSKISFNGNTGYIRNDFVTKQ